ncbi:MAG: type II toxin-antitoxin system VapC family toxin [Deltaproteobacteria bacterium]|nr:type II toxin-antitoxin system VapC family toxin [Deltaproteobacteria bacterium]
MSPATLDSSIWIPYLRTRRYASTVDPLVAAGRAWLHGVVLLELYAGTASAEDKRAVDAIRRSARELGRLVCPNEEDLCLAGQVLSLYSRRHARIRPRDHSHDVLIAIGAARTRSVLLTENVVHLQRWADLLRRRAGLRVTVVRPAAGEGTER